MNDPMKSKKITNSEITPEHLYLNRRRFMQLAAIGGVGMALAACGITPQAASQKDNSSETPETPETQSDLKDELGNPATTYSSITSYNNFYEFTTDKEGVASMVDRFQVSPWQVEVGGLVSKPLTLSLEDILKKFTRQDRIYRLRCVEGWSMVIPWQGFPLAELLRLAQPTGDARFVKFTSVMRPSEMPGQNVGFYPWPYTEGLRLDEALNDLAILATGLYGKDLPVQDGAPIRLVVPWKYGFKSIKSIVRIDLVSEKPATLWSTIAPDEYGFYSNVNPNKPHPRWSQATERRIGESSRRETLLFNGYAEEVADLYKDMNLMVDY